MMHYLFLSDAGDRERGKGSATIQEKFQAKMWVVGIIHEKCTEVTGKLRWEIQITSDYLRDLARLEGKSVHFSQGDSAGNRGRLVVKTTQFLRGADNGLLEKATQFFWGAGNGL